MKNKEKQGNTHLKIMKDREKQEKSKVDISELGMATLSRGRRATEPGIEDFDPTTGSRVPC